MRRKSAINHSDRTKTRMEGIRKCDNWKPVYQLKVEGGLPAGKPKVAM
jgi:hypothetical protein